MKVVRNVEGEREGVRDISSFADEDRESVCR